jgi:Domain of Unknown Function (DUF1080)
LVVGEGWGAGREIWGQGSDEFSLHGRQLLGLPAYAFVEDGGIGEWAATEKVTSQHEWIAVEILAQGNRVRAAFNGAQVIEWREPDQSRIKEGPIGMQLHAWTGAQEVQYKDIVIETFPGVPRLVTVKK